MDKVINFNFKRLVWLIRNDLQVQFKSSLVIIVAITSGLTLISLLSKLDYRLFSLHNYSFKILLIFGGYLLTASAFKTLHQRNQVGFYLSLPASILEKFISRLLLTSVGYIAGLSLLFFVFSVLAAGLSNLLSDNTLPVFNPLNQENLELMALYLITQSLFLVGAIQFKSMHFIKTVATTWFTIMILIIFTAFILWLIFDTTLNTQQFDFSRIDINLSSLGSVTTVLEYLFYFGFAPFCWLMAFLKLRKYEV
ncbi:MAG: hypothetical protein HOD92_09225 [Deltaproteobacteria bacterium]|jgi:hypothetical protein|nr:hypothetical protein [Deltaproteobacteria bacterium]